VREGGKGQFFISKFRELQNLFNINKGCLEGYMSSKKLSNMENDSGMSKEREIQAYLEYGNMNLSISMRLMFPRKKEKIQILPFLVKIQSNTIPVIFYSHQQTSTISIKIEQLTKSTSRRKSMSSITGK